MQEPSQPSFPVVTLSLPIHFTAIKIPELTDVQKARLGRVVNVSTEITSVAHLVIVQELRHPHAPADIHVLRCEGARSAASSLRRISDRPK